jgi:hypothetical protein
MVMKKNKITLLTWTSVVGSLVLFASVSAKATTPFYINFDANGNISGNTADAFPPGNPVGDGPPNFLGVVDSQYLDYALETPNGMELSGDLVLDMCGGIEDVVRFYAFGQQYIDVYGIAGGTAIGDLGIPSSLLSSLQTPTLTLNETILPDGDWGIVYTPTPGEPGYGGNITFTFDSDYPTNSSYCPPSAAPDGGQTIGLLGMGLAGIVAMKRKLANKSL